MTKRMPPKKPKDEQGTRTRDHERFARRGDPTGRYAPIPREEDHSEKRMSDNTGIRLILEEMREIRTNVFQMNGTTQAQNVAIDNLREDVQEVKLDVKNQTTDIQEIKSRLDRHSNKLPKTKDAKKRTAFPEFFIKNFSSIFKILLFVLLGALFLLGITVSFTDIAKGLKL